MAAAHNCDRVLVNCRVAGRRVVGRKPAWPRRSTAITRRRAFADETNQEEDEDWTSRGRLDVMSLQDLSSRHYSR